MTIAWPNPCELLPSIIPEERRGRPGAAREAALAAARENPERRLEYLMWAVYASLSVGEAREALRLLDTFPADADATIAGRARACRAWAQMLDRNWYPGNDGGEMSPSWRENLATIDSVASGDAETMLVEACAAYGPRMVLTFRDIITGASRQSLALLDQVLPAALQSLDNFSVVAAKVNAPTSVVWSLAAKADLQQRAGHREEARQALTQLRGYCMQAGDVVGVANTWMLEGDWWATPGSTPEALGLVLPDGAADAAPPIPVNTAAMQAYEQAAVILAESDAPRANAAVSLRRALLAGRAADFDAQREHLMQCERACQEAGDAAGVHLATVHRWLSDIARGDLTAVRQIAPLEWGPVHGPVAEIAAWATKRGSLTYCTGLGRLLQRSGQKFVAASEFDRAEVAFRLASYLLPQNGAVPRWTIPEALAHLDTRRNLTTRALVRQVQTLDLLPAPKAPAGDDNTWLQDLQLTLGLVTVPTGVTGAGEIGIRMIERGEQRLNALLNVAKIAHAPDALLSSDPMKALEDAKAAYKADFTKGAGLDQKVLELASSVTSDALRRARPLVALMRARQVERLGWDTQAELWYRTALECSAKAGPENRWLEILILNAWGRRAEARTVLKTALDERLVEDSILAKLAIQVGDHEAARRLFAILATTREKLGTDWRDDADRAEAAIEGGDGDTALKLVSRAIVDFQGMIDRLPRDADRVAACDDVGAAELYLIASRIHLRLARAAERKRDLDTAAAQRALAFEVSERHRALTLPPVLPASALADRKGTGAFQQWQQSATEHATAYQRLLAALLLGTANVLHCTEVLAGAERALAESEAALSPGEQAALLEARRAQSVTAKDVQKRLPADACLLEYQVVGRDYVAFAMTASDVIAHEGRIERGTLQGLASRLVRACAAGTPSPEADELAAILLKPFASILAAQQRVLVVPSGALNAVPFHVLPFRGTPLGETHVISYLPAAGLIARGPMDRPLAAGGALVVGDPAFDPAEHPTLQRLPGAEVEANAVARIYDTPDIFLAANAKEETLRPLMRDRALVHLATHGRLDEIAPNTSSIVLAERGELTVSDLIGLQFNADLVVLSACDTGRGTTTQGGDLIGLARGLLAAGVRRCVVSLWPVDDAAACVTMVGFHRRVKKGTAPALALALAQREMRMLSGAQIAERYRALGGPVAPGQSAMRRKAVGTVPQLPAFPEVDIEDVDTTVEARGGHLASIWAPFILIGA
ncbi:CHAT domain-containing protein [Reyranella soli]|uniref:CHAT domain-containing protein n=1 Tax=Reyranella soli TaxID=1230389 RepID=A0A512NQS9_9HYPH|nr:CHAT domain-containing protein [Reyranella soli]GEP61303.1 hypothetical protein RSO01_84690 [Reyranella soli]